jgi:hypothetical protein
MTDDVSTSVVRKIDQYAQDRGGRCWMSISLNERALFECEQGHLWFGTPVSMIHGKTWCPECASGTSERICRRLFEFIFPNHRFAKERPKWLTNPDTNRSLELDGYCDDLKMAFEYQGIQHYKFVPHHHKIQENLVKTAISR